MLLPLLMNLGMLGGAPPVVVGGGLRKRRRKKLAPVAIMAALIGFMPELRAAVRVRAGRVALTATLDGVPGEAAGRIAVRPIRVRAAADLRPPPSILELECAVAVLDELMQATRRQEDFLLLFDEDPTEAREWLELDEEEPAHV